MLEVAGHTILGSVALLNAGGTGFWRQVIDPDYTLNDVAGGHDTVGVIYPLHWDKPPGLDLRFLNFVYQFGHAAILLRPLIKFEQCLSCLMRV